MSTYERYKAIRENDPERFPEWVGIEETLLNAISHLGSYIRYAEERGIPLTLPTDEEVADTGTDPPEGYAILEYVLDCVESAYSAYEDGLIVDPEEIEPVNVDIIDGTTFKLAAVSLDSDGRVLCYVPLGRKGGQQ